jgi:hypothetical protein
MTNIAGLGLGHVFDVIPIADGIGFNVRNCNAVSFVCTSSNSAGVFTLTASKVFGSGYTGTGVTPFTYWYSNTAVDGTSTWTKQTLSAGNAVTFTGSILAGVIPLYTTQLPDGYNYVKMTGTVGATHLVCAVLHDLAVQRTPANLAKLGA